jgi:nucleoside-diphosphate-sugar epimerase
VRLKPRVVVIGASGYLGSRIAAVLGDVADLVRLPPPGAAAASDRAIRLQNRGALASALALAAPDHVIHAAGRLAGSDAELERDNHLATAALADAVLEAAPGAVLTALGSAAEYGIPKEAGAIREDHPCAPIDAYGRSKLAATRALIERAERMALRVNIVRPFNPIGVPLSPAQVLGAFVEKAAAASRTGSRRVVMGRLEAVRDVFAVDELTSLLRIFVAEGREGIVVNACTGIPRRIRDLVEFLNALPGGGFAIEEQGPEPGAASAVIGDPARFRAELRSPTPLPIEPILAEAWRRACITADIA